MAGDYRKYFQIEAGELLDRMTSGIARLREGNPEPDEIRSLMRLAHTLKGAAYVVNETHVGELAHELEDVLSVHSESELLPEEELRRSLQLIDELSRNVAPEAQAPVAPQPEVAKPVATAAPASVEHTAQAATVRVELADVHELMVTLSEATSGLATLRGSVESLVTAQSAAAAAAQRLRTRQAGTAADAQTRRLVDQLALALETAERKISRGVQALEREIGAAGEIASQLRLTSVDSLESSLRRAAITAAETLGKRVNFTMETHAKRVDAQMLSSLRDPLLHMVRNAVAHGIELPEIRANVGKSPVGEIRLRCRTESTELVFVCEDDGQGVDLESLREVLVERGLLTREQASVESDERIIRHIFTPGVSTTRDTDVVSGRGVGLDIVSEAIAHLRGRTSVSSEKGKGTKVELRIPLDLLSTPVISCDASGVRFAIPYEAVSTIVQFSAGNLVYSEHGKMLDHDGQLLPLISGAELFGKPRSRARGKRTAAIVRDANTFAALEVDKVIGTKTVIQKPLPSFAKALPFVAGAALDVRGTPELVLDASGLLGSLVVTKIEEESQQRKRSILVVDDSLTTRMLEQSILETAGYEVEVAASAEEGLHKASRSEFALFLVDVEMPGMNGFEFVSTVKRDMQLSSTPCILVTSRNAPEDKAKGREAGAADYIVKGDFNQQYLLTRIAELIR